MKKQTKAKTEKRTSKTFNVELTSSELKVLMVACARFNSQKHQRVQNRVGKKLRTAFLALELYS